MEDDIEIGDFPDDETPEPSKADLDKIETPGDADNWEWESDQIVFDDEQYDYDI